MAKVESGVRTKWLAGIILVLILTLLGGTTSLSKQPPDKYPLGDIPLDAATYQKFLKIRPKDTAEVLPEAYDARADGIVTPAKDQGSCGSCWAFATVGAMESHLLKSFGVGPDDLSEQQQVSCNTDNYGCSGGYQTAALYWVYKGPLYEACFPYTASDSPCEEDGCEQLGYRVVDYYTVQQTTDAFKTSLSEHGPSYWRYTVYNDFFTFWNTGTPGAVYVQQWGAVEGGHAVLLIGWDDVKGAFLCKNSWGETAGPNNDGTFWIAYGGHSKELGFGMSNFSLTSVGCTDDSDCNDGLYCTGVETCVEGVCQDGFPLECPDDGLFCNGAEVCNELTPGCGHKGNPCEEGTTCEDEPDRCVPATCRNGTCDAGEDCHNCPEDCISGTGGGTCGACFKGVCNGDCHPVKEGPDCADCAPSWCCGDGVCEGEEDGFTCAVDCGAPPVCGDGNCDAGEDPCSCADDCGAAPSTETSCTDGIDNDCDGLTDCADKDDCSTDSACTCLLKKATCEVDEDCCSNRCKNGVCR